MGEYSVDIDGELYLGREPSNLENPPSNQQEPVKPESTADIIAEWLTERKTNCERIAAMKTVEDREGWLDDAAGFAAAIKIIADHDRDIKALEARVQELVSSFNATVMVPKLREQAKTIEALTEAITAGTEKVVEQAKTIERLKNMAVGLATSWAQAWEQTSPTDTAWKDAYDQALRDRHAILTSGIDAALKEARDQ